MNGVSRRGGVLAALLCAVGAAWGATVKPVANVSLLGGQYFLDSRNTSLGGNADARFVPVITLNDRTTILPMYQGSYRGVKDVQELVGGGTLTRASMSHGISARVVHRLNDDRKVKARGGFRMDWLKEAESETLSTGLFNSRRLSGGAEVEQALFGKMNARAGYDYFTIRYPNYASLASDPKFQEAGLAAAAGKNLLDYNTHEPFFEIAWKASDLLIGRVGYDLALKGFTDQFIVTETGGFSGARRSDQVHQATLSGTVAPEGMQASVGYTFQWYKSTQNAFDAGRTLYTPAYYDFQEHRVTPSLALGLGREGRTFSLWSEMAFRKYTERLSQDSTGAYKAGEKLSTTTNTLGATVRWPVAHHVAGVLQGSWRNASANTKYEKTYKYNYDAVTYFLGVEWEL